MITFYVVIIYGHESQRTTDVKSVYRTFVETLMASPCLPDDTCSIACYKLAVKQAEDFLSRKRNLKDFREFHHSSFFYTGVIDYCRYRGWVNQNNEWIGG